MFPSKPLRNPFPVFWIKEMVALLGFEPRSAESRSGRISKLPHKAVPSY